MDVQWNLSLGTPPSLYFITSIEVTPLFNWEKRHFFLVPKPGLNLHSRDTLADHKNLWIVQVFTGQTGDRFQNMNFFT